MEVWVVLGEVVLMLILNTLVETTPLAMMSVLSEEEGNSSYSDEFLQTFHVCPGLFSSPYVIL